MTRQVQMSEDGEDEDREEQMIDEEEEHEVVKDMQSISEHFQVHPLSHCICVYVLITTLCLNVRSLYPVSSLSFLQKVSSVSSCMFAFLSVYDFTVSLLLRTKFASDMFEGIWVLSVVIMLCGIF